MFGLSIALALNSCAGDNEDPETYTPETQVLATKKLSKDKERLPAQNKTSAETDNADNLDTGDDEPRPDKQHWKVVNDTVQ